MIVLKYNINANIGSFLQKHIPFVLYATMPGNFVEDGIKTRLHETWDELGKEGEKGEAKVWNVTRWFLSLTRTFCVRARHICIRCVPQIHGSGR